MDLGPEAKACLEKDGQKKDIGSHQNSKFIRIILGKKLEFGLRIITTRKIGNAVKRNRIRRRIKEALRSMKIKHANDITIIPSAGAINSAFGEIKQNIKDQLQIAN